MEVLRTIHPIGQGAFYTEELTSIDGREANIVFDCGTGKAGDKDLLNYEALSWREKQNIDILFISHFDKDHVNGIDYLVKDHSIKRVVIPQITGYEWFWFIEDANLNKQSGKGLKIDNNLFDVIREFSKSKNGQQIIEVAPFGKGPNEIEGLYRVEDRRNEERNNVEASYPILLGGSRIIRSGSPLNPTDIDVWEYIPFNYTMGKDIDKLKEKVNDILGLGKGKVPSIEELPYSNLIDLLSANNNLEKLNDAYIGVFGTSNKSSLCVYSGFMNQVNYCHYCLKYDNSH